MSRPATPAMLAITLGLVTAVFMTVLLLADDYGWAESVGWSVGLGLVLGALTYRSKRRQPATSFGDELRDAALIVVPPVVIVLVLDAAGVDRTAALVVAVLVMGVVHPGSLLRRAVRSRRP